MDWHATCFRYGQRLPPISDGRRCFFRFSGKILHARHKFFWAFSKFPFKGLEEIGIIIKAALQACIHDLHPLAQHVARHYQPLFNNVLIQGQAGELLEPMAQVRFADIQHPGQPVKRKILVQMVVDKRHRLIDLLVLGNILPDGARVAKYARLR